MLILQCDILVAYPSCYFVVLDPAESRDGRIDYHILTLARCISLVQL